MVDVICPPLSISSIVVSLWLASCLAKSTLIGWREYYGGGGVGVDRHLCGAQQTRAFDPMLFQYWPTANGAGPILKQHWVESSCLLGELSAFWYTRAVCVWSEQAAQCSVYITTYLFDLCSIKRGESKGSLKPRDPPWCIRVHLVCHIVAHSLIVPFCLVRSIYCAFFCNVDGLPFFQLLLDFVPKLICVV